MDTGCHGNQGVQGGTQLTVAAPLNVYFLPSGFYGTHDQGLIVQCIYLEIVIIELLVHCWNPLVPWVPEENKNCYY